MLGFFLREVLTNIRRSPLMCIASVTTVMVLTLILGYFTVVMVNLERLADSLIAEIQVVAYLDDGAERLALSRQIRKLQYVENAHFISKETAFKKLIERMNGRIEMSDVAVNPLPDAFEIRVSHANELAEVAHKVERLPGVARVKYGEEVAHKMLAFNSLVRSVGVVVLSMLFLSTLLIISNTIRLTVFARRRDIEIMQMVGAAEWFIRWPFVLEGIFQGVLGATLSAGLVCGSYQLVVPALSQTVPFLPVLPPLAVLPGLVPGLILLGGLVGAMGSLLSVNRFLKVS
ncbi:MAG: permease-like cell division protein FtsX [Candidatus Eremiobacteraeota bacterium]|nr:permease-like cell division protein FtsX [Candidatus Eremiobacteraeota bacterium]